MLDKNESNPHEALARQRKAVALWALLRRANGGRPLAPESVLALDASAWKRAAQCARVNLPSAQSKAAVVELARLEAALNPRALVAS